MWTPFKSSSSRRCGQLGACVGCLAPSTMAHTALGRIVVPLVSYLGSSLLVSSVFLPTILALSILTLYTTLELRQLSDSQAQNKLRSSASHGEHL
jgi:hypothetical protein